MIISVFRFSLKTFHHILIVFLVVLNCVTSCIWASLHNGNSIAFLFVQFVVCILCIILELALAIDFNLKVGTIFIEKNFFEGVAFHLSNFLNYLSIFLLKLSLDFSFVIIVQSNHVPTTFPLQSFPNWVVDSSSLRLGSIIPNEKGGWKPLDVDYSCHGPP